MPTAYDCRAASSQYITPAGMATRDGRLRRVATLILASGPATTKFLSVVDY